MTDPQRLMDSEARRVAEGLTEAARSALLQFAESELPDGVLIVEPGDGPVVDELLSACCISHIRAADLQFIDEQPLGLRVRAVLQETSDE